MESLTKCSHPHMHMHVPARYPSHNFLFHHIFMFAFFVSLPLFFILFLFVCGPLSVCYFGPEPRGCGESGRRSLCLTQRKLVNALGHGLQEERGQGSSCPRSDGVS